MTTIKPLFSKNGMAGIYQSSFSWCYLSCYFIFLRNSDKPVFIPITRKEYLTQMLIDAENSGNSNIKILEEGYASDEKLFEAEMKVYKHDKNYTLEKEENGENGLKKIRKN